METATITTRPPLPPFTRESAIQKVRLAEDAWNTRDPGKVALAYAIDSRWRNRSEFINGRSEISLSSLANGPWSWTTGSSRKCGRSLEIASQYALPTSGTTSRVTGIAPMAMRTGNSMTRGSWLRGLPQSTIFPFRSRIANITGCSGAVPRATPD